MKSLLPFSFDGSDKSSVWSKPLAWRFWLAVSVIVPGGAALWASTQLLWLPDLPNCWVISWADASSSTRLYCARELGNRQTPEDLRQGIRLVHGIPMDDPLRKEGDRLIEQLSATTLQQAEKAYQEGDLNSAVEIAKKIPAGIWTYRQASRKIRHWQTTWAKAEAAYEKAEQQIEKRQWYVVLTLGRELLMLDNQYWRETKYPELMRSLQAAKESVEWKVSTTDVDKLKAGSLDSLLNQHQTKQAAQAKSQLQKAQAMVGSSDPKALRQAIEAAQSVLYGTPDYETAQALADRLQQQVETLENQPLFDRANQLASKGDAASLQAAIDEANKISWGTALYDEANARVEQWREQMYEAEVKARTEQLENMPETIEVPEFGVSDGNGESLPLPLRSPGVGRSNPEPEVSPTHSPDSLPLPELENERGHESLGHESLGDESSDQPVVVEVEVTTSPNP
jgi:hypothetical protein